jgi:hypothetical protein
MGTYKFCGGSAEAELQTILVAGIWGEGGPENESKKSL